MNGMSRRAALASARLAASGPFTLSATESRHRGFDHRPREEARVDAGPERGRVGEDEVAERLLAEHARLDERVGLGQRLPHVGHVPVADVRAEDRFQARAERVHPRVERDRGQAVVGRAAEVEALGEDVADVLGARDTRGRELVQRRRVLVGLAEAGKPLRQSVETGRHGGRAVAAEEVREERPVEVRGVVVLEVLAVPLLPVTDDAGIELAGPPHTAFEEGEAQLGEAARHAGEEERAAGRLAGRREAADVVGDVARERGPAMPAHRRGMERRRHPQLPAARPDGVVIVGAVGTEGVDPAGAARRTLERERAMNVAREDGGLETQLADGVVQLVAHGGQELDRVAVRVDDGMRQAGANAGGGCHVRHLGTPDAAPRARVVYFRSTGTTLFFTMSTYTSSYEAPARRSP